MKLQYRGLLFGVLFIGLFSFVAYVFLHGVAKGNPGELELSLAHGVVMASAFGLAFAITVHIRMVLQYLIGLCVNILVLRLKKILRQMGKDPEKDWAVDKKAWGYRVNLVLWMTSWYVMVWSILMLVYAGLCSYFFFAGVLGWDEFVSLSGVVPMLPLVAIAGIIATLFVVGNLAISWLLVRRVEILLRRREEEERLRRRMFSSLNGLDSVRRVPRWPVPMQMEPLVA